ncbi:MAG: DUF6263 family protein [Planctomycetes bacterium]|nr:DUF6263 family protein [Planctomycetota bacterium]
MRFGTKIRRLVLFAAFAVTAVLLIAPFASAEDQPLRWKFEVGEKLNYDMVQDMTLSMSGGQGGPASTTVQQQMNMKWDVQGVNEEGEAVIRQKIDRVRMQMTGPMGKVEYDSDSQEPPAGMAAMVAPMFEAMTRGEFELTITARGEVKEVKVPEEVLSALKNSPQAAQMGDMATPEGFQKMIMQSALVLPEKSPSKGETWSNKIDLTNPAAGKQTVETSYTYDGTKEVEGKTYAVFRPKLTMQFEGNAAVQMKMKDQTSEGEVLFDIEQGRLNSSTLKQNVTMEMTVAGMTMEQKIIQAIEVKVTPTEEDQASGSQEPVVQEAK